MRLCPLCLPLPKDVALAVVSPPTVGVELDPFRNVTLVLENELGRPQTSNRLTRATRRSDSTSPVPTGLQLWN